MPNNSTLALKMFANLFKATGDDKFLSACPAMLNWLRRIQLQTGELPYGVEGSRARVHFLCYQYNAFELLDLIEYQRITRDEEVIPIIKKLAHYLAHAVTASGSARFNCHRDRPEVLYYAAAVAAALSESAAGGIGPYEHLASRLRVGAGATKDGRRLSILLSNELRNTLGSPLLSEKSCNGSLSLAASRRTCW